MNPLYGNELNEFYVRKVRRNFAQRAARLAAIRTKDEALKVYQSLKASYPTALILKETINYPR